jgi:hypothetical protein
LNDAEIEEVACAETGIVETVKAAVVALAATVRLAGTVAMAELLLTSVTWMPPAGAAVFRSTVPVEAAPPTTVAGFRVTDWTEAGLTINVAVSELAELAVIDTLVSAPTASDVTENVAEEAFAGTVTLAGTVAEVVSLLDSATTDPPAGAVPFKVTVPMELTTPPSTLVGFNTRDDSPAEGGVTVRVVLWLPLNVAVTEGVAVMPTGFVFTVKLAVVLPDGTVTLTGTLATVVSLLESVTKAPPLVAGAFNVTVAVKVLPPITAAGLRLSDCTEPAWNALLNPMT